MPQDPKNEDEGIAPDSSNHISTIQGCDYGSGLPPVFTLAQSPQFPAPQNLPPKEKWWKDRKFILECLGFLVLLVYTIFSGLQWHEIKRTNGLTQDALKGSDKALSQTLEKLQGQIVAMNGLVAQTGIQAAQTTVLATAAGKEAEASKIMAENAAKQAVIARNSERLMEAELLPFISLQLMDLAEPIVPGKKTKVANNFINEGGTIAFEVQNLSTSSSIVDGSDPPFVFEAPTGSRANISAKGTFDGDIYIGPQTPEQIAQIKLGIRKVYVVGKIIYTDFLHTEHHTFYCMVLDPHTGKMNGCKNQGKSD
ncbi:MAG: hypothetical protein JWQ42_981 [Edaphobacter sp.]|nr:hypothetical protein [Edaphobacter sp.]